MLELKFKNHVGYEETYDSIKGERAVVVHLGVILDYWTSINVHKALKFVT